MKKRNTTNVLVLSFCFILCFNSAKAQTQIFGPSSICIGDLANFKIINSSGKTIKTYNWALGTGNGSTMSSPSFLYKNTGNFTVKCSVIYTDNSMDNAVHSVEVLALPIADFVDSNGASNFCQYKANLCYTNQSKEAVSGRELQKLIITWGDGYNDVYKTTPLPQKVYHNFENVGDFKVRFEVVDTRGCKNTEYKRVKIVDGVLAKISSNSIPSCNKSELCVYAKVTPNDADFVWYVNGTKQVGKADSLCLDFIQNTTVDIRLIAENMATKCKDTFQINKVINVAPAVIKLDLPKHAICFKDSSVKAKVNAYGATAINWYVNGILRTDKGDEINFNAAQENKLPGKYTIKCIANFGTCVREIMDTFRILGPVAKFGIWNSFQCNTNNRVFFVDSSEFTSAHCAWQWTAADNESDSCTIWRSKNINRYKNCIFTLDWWGKHKFPANFKGQVKLTIYDSISGCIDEEAKSVNLKACSECFASLSGYKEICQGDLFLNVKNSYFNPRYFSLDTGRTWLPFPSKVSKPYLGLYGVSFIVPQNFPSYAEDYGDDSFRIIKVPVVYDTFFIKDYLMVNPTPELEYLAVSSSGCHECSIKMEFKKQHFKADEELQVNWKNKFWKFQFEKDTIIDSIYLYSNIKGGDSMHIKYLNKNGCSSHHAFWVGCGMELMILGDSVNCFGNNSCFELRAKNMAQNNWYLMDGTELEFQLIWNKVVLKNTEEICRRIDSIGNMPLLFVADNNQGCRDTLLKNIVVHKIIAGTTRNSEVAFCTELKQLFDSSQLIGGNGYIESYGWNFNRRNRNSTLKDPVQLFESGGKNHIIHWVSSSYGCSDTMEFDVEIAGSNPFFTIPDTLGCAAFNAKFINKSKNCKTYIWEFGDENNSILSVSDTNDVSFFYQKPGIYPIRLVGIDTIYSPITGEAYHCHAYYPPTNDTACRVRVLPYYKSSITGPDSVCANELFYLTSHTDSSAIYENWVYPNGSVGIRTAGSTLPLKLKDGNYEFKVRPTYNRNPDEPYCADTPVHKIVVLGIEADFDFLSPNEDGFYQFTNKSSSTSITYHWNFGHSASGINNFSNDKNPVHDYFPDTGSFMVCLEVKNALNCYDTICKLLPQYYMENIYLANVFTPGINDGKNDLYDVVIYGEKNYDLKIYNRYGELVYQSNTDGDRFSDNINWNGRENNNGAVCPEGVYFYQFTWSYKRSPDTVHKVSGSVNLIR